MLKKAFLIFSFVILFPLRASDVDLYLDSATQKNLHNESKQIKQPSYSCDREGSLFLCYQGTKQAWSALASVLAVFCVHAHYRPRTAPGGEVQLSGSSLPSLLTGLSISALVLAWPYIQRYQRTGHIKPTCYHTAFWSPGCFFEIPYVFYQRKKAQRS